MKVRFLLDEHIDPDLRRGILRSEPSIDPLRVGDPEAPPFGTLDPQLLRWLEVNQRLLITLNRRSMPGHLAVHHSAGGHTWGLAFVDATARHGQIIESLLALWVASEAEEWVDAIIEIPL